MKKVQGVVKDKVSVRKRGVCVCVCVCACVRACVRVCVSIYGLLSDPDPGFRVCITSMLNDALSVNEGNAVMWGSVGVCWT